MSDKKPADSFSKIDRLFENSPGAVRVKATNGKSYSGQVSAPLVADFLTASQKDAAVALELANAETLKRSSRVIDANGNAVSLTQTAATE